MFRHLAKKDHAISPVIGTILMIAATVIIAGAVYAAVNLYSGKTAHQATEAAWKAQALDSNGDGTLDTIKVTYITGASGVANNTAAGATVTVKDANGGAINPLCYATANCPTSWSPGDFMTWKPASAGTYYVTVSQSGSDVLDQALQTQP
jgi:flagellin-like protein